MRVELSTISSDEESDDIHYFSFSEAESATSHDSSVCILSYSLPQAWLKRLEMLEQLRRLIAIHFSQCSHSAGAQCRKATRIYPCAMTLWGQHVQTLQSVEHRRISEEQREVSEQL